MTNTPLSDHDLLITLNQQVINMSKQIDSLVQKLEEYIPDAIQQKEQITILQQEVKSLKDNNTWLWRTAITALIFPVIVGIVVAVILA